MNEPSEEQLRQEDAAGDAVAARRLGAILDERGDLGAAEAAYERAAGRGDVDALGKLAILIDIHRDDPERAEAAYRRADAAGSVDGAGNLGRILKERGDLRGAEDAFRRCVERGSVRALADYAGLLSQRDDATPQEISDVVRMLCPVEDRFHLDSTDGQADRAMEAFAPVMVFEGMWERCDPAAMEAGVRAADADGSATGAYHLGILLRARGELRESVDASTRAGERGYLMGLVNAGVALSELGDLEVAEAVARRAEQEGEAAGAGLLASILDLRGDSDGALEANRRADAGGHGVGSFNLGVELANRGQLEKAEGALARAEERGVNDSAAARESIRRKLDWPPIERDREANEPAWNWATRLERLGDLRGASAAYAAAMESGEEPVAPLAILRCAEFLEARQDSAAAEEMFQRIGDVRDPAIRAGAWRGIARYRGDRGDAEGAVEALSVVTETGDADEAPRAWRNIGVYREDLGDIAGARLAYGTAIELDHPKHSQGARVNLAQLLDREGDHAQAEGLFREAAESGHPEEGPRARVLLGQMLEEQGDVDRALSWFESAIDDGEGEWAQRAALNAGGIYLMKRGDYDRAVDAFRIAERIEEPQQSLMASYLRGEAERQRDDEHQALDAYLHVVGASDDGAGPVRYAAAKRSGVILIHRKDYGRARELLVVAAGTDDPAERARALLLLGSCERSLGDRDAAVAVFRQTVAIEGVPGDVRELAMRSLSELGK